ncbi:hypothetical protein GCM10010216_62340 [Streptomyces flaveolus]|nr:hypothetical protein GCM10010216_62340 [Streptomyces flaveolus]
MVYLGVSGSAAEPAAAPARLNVSDVDLTGSVTSSEPSTLAVADLDATGQAAYTFYADGATDWQWTASELAATRRDDAVCLHTESLALIRRPGAAEGGQPRPRRSRPDRRPGGSRAHEPRPDAAPAGVPTRALRRDESEPDQRVVVTRCSFRAAQLEPVTCTDTLPMLPPQSTQWPLP